MIIVLRHIFLLLTCSSKNIDTESHVTAREIGEQSSHVLKKERMDYFRQLTVLFMKELLESLIVRFQILS